MKFDIPRESVEYIYMAHIIEHFNWLDGKKLLFRCYRWLERGGVLRLIIPDYEKIFSAYLADDNEFFESFRKALNKDCSYYRKAYNEPVKLLKERKKNPPPEWHTSSRMEHREKVSLRIRYFKRNIDIVHWFTYQFGEHLTLYDFESLKDTLLQFGFKEVEQTEIIEGFDSDNENRKKSSLYLEATK